MIVHKIDARGLLCPLPILKLKKLHSQLSAPAIIEILATDKMVLLDIPLFCVENDIEIMSQNEIDTIYYFQLRKF